MKLELEINDSILQRENLTEFDVKMMIGVTLYNNLTTTGKIAQILGIDRRTFIEEMGKYGASLFDDELDDLIKRYNNA